MATTHGRRRRMWTEFPPDILMFHILPRLPAKSVFRFMSVSKQWHLFLKTNMFADMHLHRVTNDDHQNHHKLLVLHTKMSSEFRTIDCEAPDDELTPSRPFPFGNNSDKYIDVLTSCNGLVCVGMKYRHGSEYVDLIIWNPLTGDYKTLSKSNAPGQCFSLENGKRSFQLYYKSVDDDYQLLRVSNSFDVYIYSLKSDSWRKLGSTKNLGVSGDLMGLVLLNAEVYFLIEVHETKTRVIRFDTKTEKFKRIATPTFGNSTSFLSFTVQRGFVYLFSKFDSWDSYIKVSRMNGDRVWSKRATYSLNRPWKPQALHLMRNGNWIMRHSGYLYKGKLKELIKRRSGRLNKSKMYIPEKGKYIETFVSPNRYN